MIWRLFICLFLLVSTPVYAKKHYKDNLSVTATFRDEAPYLKEWIEYHQLQGVNRFYLYNNLSQDNYVEVLWPYIQKGIVELIEWPKESSSLDEWNRIQIEIYQDAVNRSKKRTKWLAIIDIDEFLVPVKDANLTTLLSHFDNAGTGGICGIWIFFGTSGVSQIPSTRTMIETLVLNGDVPCGGDFQCVFSTGQYKSIVRPDRVQRVLSPHYCAYNGCGHGMIGVDRLQINHYWTRDEWYLYNFKIPRRVKWDQDQETTLLWARGMNKRNNYGEIILRVVPELRKRLNLSEE